MHKYHLFAVAAFLSALPLDSVLAEECLPALKYDVVDLSVNTETNLFILDKSDSENKKRNKDEIFAQYGAYAFNYESARFASSRIKRLLELQYNDKQSEALHTSILSDKAVDAYVECLKSKRLENVWFSYSKGLLSGTSFGLTMYWYPTYPNPPKKEMATARIFGNGSIVDSNSRRHELELDSNSSDVIEITRDPTEPTEVSVKVGPNARTIEFPTLPKKKIVLEVLKGNTVATGGREIRGSVGALACAQLENNDRDALMVPGSFRLRYIKRDGSGVNFGEDPVSENERGACQKITVHYPSPFKTHANVEAYGEIAVFRVVPR